ncbi:MAG: DNA polymerase IV [Opitutaceae bacterium]|nr:DNA polymerase IV [Opitutaceae bacterium]
MSALPLIVHLDADAFFVSCELALQPALRGKRCAVGGRERGIIASANYEARAGGVYTPMPTAQALKLCPDLILLPPTRGLYSEISRQLFDLCETLTPCVQRHSIDEGFLDLGPCGFTVLAEIEKSVRALQQRIVQQLGVTVSFGLATNKLVAAIASKAFKPRGFTLVSPGTEADFLAPFKINVIPGIGKITEARLNQAGLRLVKDIIALPTLELQRLFGNAAPAILALARGEDTEPVEVLQAAAQSYSTQETFPQDIGNFSQIEQVTKRMIDELMPKIRADDKKSKTLTIKIRYSGMEDNSTSRSLTEASDLESSFYPFVTALLKAVWTKRRPLRLVSVRFSGIEHPSHQLEIFKEVDAKKRRLAGVLDQLNSRGPQPIVRSGHQLAHQPKRPGDTDHGCAGGGR